MDDRARCDRTGSGSVGPPAGLLDSPLRQVQVESPHRGQALAVADSLDGDGALLARAGHDRLLPRQQTPLPGFGDLSGQVQTADPRGMAFQGFSEPATQATAEIP